MNYAAAWYIYLEEGENRKDLTLKRRSAAYFRRLGFRLRRATTETEVGEGDEARRRGERRRTVGFAKHWEKESASPMVPIRKGEG